MTKAILGRDAILAADDRPVEEVEAFGGRVPRGVRLNGTPSTRRLYPVRYASFPPKFVSSTRSIVPSGLSRNSVRRTLETTWRAK